MTSYKTIDYLPDLTEDERLTADIMGFSSYTDNSNDYDSVAIVLGSENYAILHSIYKFTAIKGATYDIVSTSYFDPFSLRIYDSSGNLIEINDEIDDGDDIFVFDGLYSQDMILDWVAPYGGEYYVQADWNQGFYYDSYALTILEDKDTANTGSKPIMFSKTFSVAENSSTGKLAGQMTAIDEDGDAITYSITAGNIDVDQDGKTAFLINSSTGVITVNDSGDLDYEGTRTFTLTTKASDSSSSSSATATVQLTNVNDVPTGSVTISGSAAQGQTLKASHSLADADGLGTIRYQWKADGKAISGATSSTYKLTQAEVGKAVSVTASYTDLQGTAESKTSSTTKEVLNGAITGTTGNNTLMGTHAADKLSGLAGDDIYYVNHASDTISESSGGGTDVAYSYLSSYTLAANVENGRIMAAAAANLSGNALNNILYAGTGNNTLNGGTGTEADTVSYQYGLVSGATSGVNANLATGKVSGSSGTDKLVNIENLTGSSLNDTLVGSKVANVLTGGLGSDSLYGGAGDKVKDIFDFNAITESKTGTARDKVYDFVSKIDKVDLGGIDANTATAKAGDQAFAFSGTSAKANSVWFKVADVDGNAATKDLVVYGDVSGDAKADFEIGLVGVTVITATDFAL